MSEAFTKEQKAFLEECNLEFSDRYSESDLEYKAVYDAGIPSPPIMYPWNNRPKLIGKRNRGHYGGQRNDRFNNRHNDRYSNNYSDNRNNDWNRRRDHYGQERR